MDTYEAVFLLKIFGDRVKHLAFLGDYLRSAEISRYLKAHNSEYLCHNSKLAMCPAQ